MSGDASFHTLRDSVLRQGSSGSMGSSNGMSSPLPRGRDSSQVLLDGQATPGGRSPRRMSPTRGFGTAPGARPVLSRPSSREQILNEFIKGATGKPESSLLSSFQAVNRTRGQVSTTVQFNVCVSTNLGERVVVVGNCDALGMWEPRNGLVLDTNSTIFPLWQGEAAVPSGDAVEYKYVIVNASDGESRWECDIDNRLFTPEGTRAVLEDGQFNVETARLLTESKQSVEKKGKRGVMHFTEMDMEIEKDDTLYVLSYRLPLACARDESGKLTFEWLTMLSDSQIRQAGDTKVMRSMSRHATYVIESLRQLRPRCNVWFVGGLGVHVAEEEREQVMETLSREYQCIPIFLPKDMGSQFEDLCHDVLKPVFHFVHPTSGALSRTFDRSSTSWQLYCEVNNYYVTPVVEHCNEGDFVFVFDPELLMAPNLIGSRARTANVGFFFNVPFPSSEIFRTLPVRKQILTSLLNANFIQFHDYTYARHFLSCCSTLLGLEHRPTRGGLTQVHFHGHSCYIRAAHVGIDAAALQQRMHEPGIQREIETWNERFMTRGKHVVLAGYADMDPLSGITLSLKAFRNILRENEKYRSCMLFVQVAIPLHDSRGDVMHAEYVDQIKKEAAAIEEDFPGSLLMYYEKMPFAPRCALFSVCDALVMASVRHGLSLVPFELVMCSAYGKKQASLCVSEFAACSRVLPCCMRINPFRDEDTAKAIAKCLQQAPFERRHHHAQQVDWCLTHTVHCWAEMILLDMKRCRADMRQSGKEVARSALNRVGLVKSNYKEISGSVLKPELVNGAYSEATTRLVIVDVDLLIRPREEMGDEKKSAFLRSLQMLVNEIGNLVFLLSSETPEHLLAWLGGREERWLEKIGLAAEDGYYYKWPGSPVERWDVRLEVPVQWKEMCKNMMQNYTERTTGSFMEDNKVASLTWHYGNTDPQFGAMQGKELLNHLEETSAHMPVDVVMGKSFVRVRHKEMTKGALIRHVVNHYNNRGGVDFILGLGDDKMEKDMFTTLDQYKREAKSRIYQGKEQPVKVFTCTVGGQPSFASYCLYSLDDVGSLLRGMSLKIKRKMKSAATMLELAGMG